MKVDIKNLQYNDFYSFLLNETGLKNIETNKKNINQFIDKRIKSLKINKLEYLNILRNDNYEKEKFFNIATVNETYFFREEKHFIILNTIIIPELFKIKKNINVLSLACSSGEEALSLALIINDFIKDDNTKSFNIYGYDINTDLLDEYNKNQYKKNSFRFDGSTFHYLMDIYGNYKNQNWEINSNLKKHINLSYLNIYKEDFNNINIEFDIILFRNTLIYMNKNTKKLIINKIITKLNNNGYLFLGMSEIPGIKHDLLNLQVSNNTYYFKKENKVKNSHLLKKSYSSSSKNIQIETKIEKIIYDVIEVEKFANELQKKSSYIISENLKNNKNYQIAEKFCTAIKYINKNELKKAVNILKDINKKYITKEIFPYLFGFIMMLKNNNNKALEYFTESYNLNNYFWLSKFYTAKILTEIDQNKALEEFISCLEIINKMEKNNQANIYNFLTDNFNDKYFINMCESWITKLKNRM